MHHFIGTLLVSITISIQVEASAERVTATRDLSRLLARPLGLAAVRASRAVTDIPAESPELLELGVTRASTIDVVMSKLNERKIKCNQQCFEALNEEIKRRLSESVFEVDANLWDNHSRDGPRIKLCIRKLGEHGLHHFDFPIDRGMIHSCRRRNGSIDLTFTPPQHLGDDEQVIKVSVRIRFKRGKENSNDKLVVRWNCGRPEAHFDVKAIQWNWSPELWRTNDARFKLEHVSE